MPVPEQTPQGAELSREAFAQYVQQQLLAQAGVATIQADDLELTLSLRGGKVRVQLEPFYASYQQDPTRTRLDTVVGALLRSVEDYKPGYLVADFERLRPQIYPMLKPLDLLFAVRDNHLPLLAYQPFLADLMICYVIEEEGSLSYINEQHIDAWQTHLSTIHTQALDNLRERTTHISYTTLGEGAQRVFLYNSQDGYDATRLLLTDMLETWRIALPERLVAGIPNRDLLIVCSDQDRSLLSRIAGQIQADAAEPNTGLTDQLFTLRDGNLHLYTWE